VVEAPKLPAWASAAWAASDPGPLETAAIVREIELDPEARKMLDGMPHEVREALTKAAAGMH
jgi:hypothetical protein